MEKNKLANLKTFQIARESFFLYKGGPVFKPLVFLLGHVVENYVISLNVVGFTLSVGKV